LCGRRWKGHGWFRGVHCALGFNLTLSILSYGKDETLTKETYVCGYKVLVAESIIDLAELVREEREYGWQPQRAMEPIRKSETARMLTQTLVPLCEK
jgi:hypothetical protein